MPGHYGMRGNNSLLKKHMMPPVQDKPPEKPQPEPIAPPPLTPLMFLTEPGFVL